MKKSLLMLTIGLVTLVACNTNVKNSSSSISTNSSGIGSTNSSASSTISNNSSSSTTKQVTNISQAAVDSLKGSMMLEGTYKIDAVRYGSEYDGVYELIQIYDDNAYYGMESSGGQKLYEANLFNDNDFAAYRTLTEMNVIEENLMTDNNGEYLMWEDFENRLSTLQTTDFELQEDGTYSCVNKEAARLLGVHIYGYDEEMAKMSLIVKNDKVVKIDFATVRYTYEGVVYQDSGSFVISNHGTAKVPEISLRESKAEHEALAAAFDEIELNYTARVNAEVTPYGYSEPSTGEYTYYFVDEYLYVDNGTEEDSFGYYLDAGTLYTFGVNDGESYFVDLMEGAAADLSGISFDFTSFAPEMFTYEGEGVFVVEDEFAPVIASLVSLDMYAEYANRVTIKLDENNKLQSIKYDFYVEGASGGYGSYQYTFTNVGSTVSPVTIDGLLSNIEIIKNIPDEVKGKWTVEIDGQVKTIRISSKSAFVDTTQAILVSCNDTTFVVSVNDEEYTFTVNDANVSLTYNDVNYELTRADDSKWDYDAVKAFTGTSNVPAFTNGSNYSFDYSQVSSGAYVMLITVTGEDASTAWEEEYAIDLLVAGFIQDTSYSYEDGYGYIFASSDGKCIVQFYYDAEYDEFAIILYV